MRTLPIAAPATAAPPAPIPLALRKTIILAKIDKLTQYSPPSLYSWEYQAFVDHFADVAQLGRLSRGPLSHVLRISERIARAYGMTMDQIDPCHGEAT
jgi:hypothetical protein